MDLFERRTADAVVGDARVAAGVGTRQADQFQRAVGVDAVLALVVHHLPTSVWLRKQKLASMFVAVFVESYAMIRRVAVTCSCCIHYSP